MKSLGVALLYFTVCIFSLNAQSGFEIGLTSGPEWSYPIADNKDEIERYQPFGGFNVALRLRHNFNQKFSLVGGMEYARIYFNDPFQTPTFGNVSYRANQLRVPVLFQMNFGKPNSQFFFNVGPTFLFTFRDEDYNNIFTTNMPNMPSVGYPYNLYNDANIGGMLGSGYSYSPLNWFRIFIEARLCGPFFGTPPNINYNGNRTLTLSFDFGLSFRIKPPKKQF